MQNKLSKHFPVSQEMGWPSLFGIVSVNTDADACDCTRGLRRHCETEGLALEADPLKKNPLPHQGIKPTSVLCLAFWSGTLPAELSSVVNDGQGTK